MEQINTKVSIECTLKSNGTLPNSGEHSVCSEKESGGYSMVIYGDKLTFTAYVGGGYKNAQTPIVSGRWYHAVGTWDGQMVRLYVDGVLAAATPAAGTLGLPTGNSPEPLLHRRRRDQPVLGPGLGAQAPPSLRRC